MTRDDREPSILSRGSEFVRIGGLHFDEVSGSRVRGSIELGEQHHTPWGVVHGGVYAAAVETAASVGASTAVEGKGQVAFGVSNSTDFLPSLVLSVRIVSRPQPQSTGSPSDLRRPGH